MSSVPPKAGAVTVIMLLRSHFHWKSWDHSVTLTLVLDFFKWYWFRKSGFDGLAEVRGWLNMSSPVRLFSCPDQSCWLLWPSQDVFSRLSCGLRTFFCCVNNKPDTNQSMQTFGERLSPSLYLYTAFPSAEVSVALITELWLNLFRFVNGCHFSPFLLKPQCDCNCKGKHTVRCEEWLKKCSCPRFPSLNEHFN